MKNLLPKYLLDLIQHKNHLVFIGGFFLLGVLLIILQISSHSTAAPQQESTSPDTYIPKGFVLVPIDLQNAESVSAIIDDYAIVDLYVAALPGQKNGLKVGHKLRLLRAPLNPKTFAVLVPENEAQVVVSSSGPLFAALQNKDLKETGRIEQHKKVINHVEYYSGGRQ